MKIPARPIGLTLTPASSSVSRNAFWVSDSPRILGASLMPAQGTDLYVVSEVLGHPSVAITKDVYGHLVEGQRRAAAALMSAALLSEIGSQNGSQER